MRVAFRVDASAAIGSGHLYRCLTLANYLAQHHRADCHFLTRATDPALTALVDRQGHHLHRLAGAALPPERDLGDDYAAWLGVSAADDAKATRAALAAIGDADWLCVDHYALDAQWEAEARLGGRMLAIDDLANREHVTDLLLDQNAVPDLLHRYDAWIPETTGRLLGPSYALLRPEFATWRERRINRPAAKRRRVMIFYGSSDSANLTLRTLEAIADSGVPDLRIDAIVGATNPNAPAIEALATRLGYVDVQGPGADMAELMARADLAFGAAGTTSWERCCLGLPSLIVVLAENQRAIAAGVAQAGAAVPMGDADRLEISDISAHFQSLISNETRLSAMADAGMKLVDSKGCARVVATMSCPPSR